MPLEKFATRLTHLHPDSWKRLSDWLWLPVDFLLGLVLGYLLVGGLCSAHFGSSFALNATSIYVGEALGIATATCLFRRRRSRRRKKLERRHAARLDVGLCPECQYKLRGLTEPRCPECGLDLPPEVLTKFATCPKRPPDAE